jgi:seryl-tRNA synthetase
VSRVFSLSRGEEAQLRVCRAGTVGNEVHPSVPVAESEAENRVEREVGGRPRPPGLPEGAPVYHHHELLSFIGGYDPEKGVLTAGHRGYYLMDVGARLNIALIHYALDFLAEREYTAVQPPYFMNKDVLGKVAQLADYDEQLYHVSGESEDTEKFLIATSEQPICALHMNDWLVDRDLPKRYAGWSTCFRKEAGSHGRDTWGIFRVHQFDKIEQFVVCAPHESWDHHEAMIKSSEDFYKSLGIPYRVITLVSKEVSRNRQECRVCSWVGCRAAERRCGQEV